MLLVVCIFAMEFTTIKCDHGLLYNAAGLLAFRH